MPATKKTTTKRKASKTASSRTSSRSVNSVERKWKTEGELGAADATILKYAKLIDSTDSTRDMRSLVTGMFEMIDRKKALEAAEGKSEAAEAPVFKILKAASGD